MQNKEGVAKQLPPLCEENESTQDMFIVRINLKLDEIEDKSLLYLIL